MKKFSFKAVSTGALALTMAFGAFSVASAAEVNVYSYRQEVLIKPLLDKFTEKTGIMVNLVSGKADALLERLKSEGINSPADVLLSVDAGRLIRAQDAGVLQPIQSAELEKLIPGQYRDPMGNWFGLSLRSRVILAAKDRVKEGEIKTYEDLADPKWKGRVCIRSSSNIYNQSMLAAMIVHKGAEEAQKWANAVVANMARKPQGGDRDQIKAVAAGECDIAVANTYYFGQMQTATDGQEKAAAAVNLIWPNQDDLGAHVNISGAGVTKSAKHKAEAIKLIEFLASDEAQKIYTESVFEYPVRDGIEISPVLKSWGSFKADTLPLAKMASQQSEALKIFDRADWR